MSEALLGAIIGGLIGIAGQFVSQRLDFRKWRTERLIEHLREERKRLEVQLDELTPKMQRALTEEAFDAKMGATVLHRCPSRVRDAFSAMIDARIRQMQGEKVDLGQYWFKVLGSCQAALADVDRRIEAALSSGGNWRRIGSRIREKIMTGGYETPESEAPKDVAER